MLLWQQAAFIHNGKKLNVQAIEYEKEADEYDQICSNSNYLRKIAL